MPLTARVKTTSEVVCIADIPDPASRFGKGEIACPYCNGDMTIVIGNVKINHFRHMPGPVCSDPFAGVNEPETIEHIVGKIDLYNMLKEIYPPNEGFKVIVEHPLENVGRRADVFVSHPKGWDRAYEIQLSNVSHTELEERTRAYESAGITACWILGDKAWNTGNIEWSIERQGKAYRIKFERELHEKPITKNGK